MTDTPITKLQRTAPYEIFETTAKKLRKNTSQLGDALGYSASTSSTWKAAGKMPFVAAVACRALLAEAGEQDLRLLVLVPKDKTQALESVLSAMGLTHTAL